MRRVYHHYTKLEEVKAGMWRISGGDEAKSYKTKSADLMRNPELFLASMRQAVKEWPNSCEHNMTASTINRQAWLGHAGCCIATGSPEECTRIGWHTLNQSEQDEANRMADIAIMEWENKYLEFEPRLCGRT